MKILKKTALLIALLASTTSVFIGITKNNIYYCIKSLVRKENDGQF